MSARDPGTYARLHLAYFYDIGLPSRYAAPIQFLNTCRAACELGATATLYTNRLATSVEECLAFYGLAPHERLRIVPLFAAPWRGHALRRELGRLARDTDPRARRIILSRGESGIALAPHLARLRRDARGRDWRFIYEAHKLSFAQQAEPLRQDLPPATRRRIERAVARTHRRERAAITGADGLICLTEGLRAALATSFPVASPTLLLPSGVAIPTAVPAAEEGRDIDILYAGKLERRKGVHDLIAALRALPGRRLWIAGGTPEELAALRRWAGEQGVADRVTFTGFIAPTRVSALYARARVGVCPLPRRGERHLGALHQPAEGAGANGSGGADRRHGRPRAARTPRPRANGAPGATERPARPRAGDRRAPRRPRPRRAAGGGGARPGRGVFLVRACPPPPRLPRRAPLSGPTARPPVPPPAPSPPTPPPPR